MVYEMLESLRPAARLSSRSPARSEASRFETLDNLEEEPRTSTCETDVAVWKNEDGLAVFLAGCFFRFLRSYFAASLRKTDPRPLAADHGSLRQAPHTSKELPEPSLAALFLNFE
jgi:hypothetical protein